MLLAAGISRQQLLCVPRFSRRSKDAWTYDIGAALGHMVAPGVGGAIAGATARKVFSLLAKSDGNGHRGFSSVSTLTTISNSSIC